MDKEERFLKTRQEREEQRRLAVEGREVSATTVQRQQFETQSAALGSEVESLVKEHKIEEAKEKLNTLRTLIQDTASSASLTAYEMTKSNQLLARLEQSVSNAGSTSSGGGSGGGGGGGGKKFRFSSKAKAKVEERTEAPVTAPSPTTAETSPLPSVPHGKVYGGFTSGTVFIAPARALFVRDCTDTILFCAPTAGSAFFTNLSRCTLFVCCHQLRLKSCTDLEVYVWCSSTPIIEHCNGVRFGPYSCWEGLAQSRIEGRTFPSVEAWAVEVGEQKDVEAMRRSYREVDDFLWLKKSQSPHWSVMGEGQWQHRGEVFGEPAQTFC